MKTSDQALALRQKRDEAIRAAYRELNKQQKWSQGEIYAKLSDRFYLLERQLQYIVRGS